MKIVNNQIYELRKQLGISQTNFGSKISLSKAAISGFEKGKTNPSEQTIRSICREFKVNYAWLVYGEGEMFNTIQKSLIDRLADEYALNDIQIKIIKSILELTDDQINAFTQKFFGFQAIEKDHQK